MPGVDTAAKPEEAAGQLRSEIVEIPPPALPHRANADFSPFDFNAAASIAKIELGPQQGASAKIKQTIDVRTFDVTIETNTGSRTERHDIEVRAKQDVLDLLPYAIIDGEVKFALTLSIRPALLARNSQQHNQNGLLWSLPGAYIEPDSSAALTETAARILRDKLGLVAVGDSDSLEFLAGSVFPAPRTSSEQVHRRAIQVHPINSEYIASAGTGFAAQRVTKFFSANEIFDSMRSGELKDLRIVDAVCNFAQNHPELNIFPEKSQIADIQLVNHNATDTVKSRILSSEQVIELLGKPSSLPHGINRLHLQEIRTNPSYLEVRSHEANPVCNDDSHMPSFEAGVVQTQDPKCADSFDCAGICKIDGEVYVVIREAVRPAIKARDLAPHAIRGVFPATNFEGIGGTCPADIEANKAVNLVKNYITNNFGVSVREGSDPVLLYSGFPSAGFTPQVSHLYFYQADPGKDIEKWDPSVRLLRYKDYKELADQGFIRNLSLSSTLGLLDSELGKQEDIRKNESTRSTLRQRYLSLLDRGSEIHAWLTQDDNKRGVFNILKDDKRFRLLVCLAENELGLVMARMKDKEEKSFFSPTLPLYPVMSHKLGTGVAVLHFAHDLMHYAIGDYIPASIGAKDPHKHFQDFLKMYHENEIIAGWYSDYVLPSILGSLKSRALLGRDSLHDLATICKINEPAKAREIYAKMERDGIIDPALLQDPQTYARIRDTIIKATLYAHIMFKSHARAVYDNWMAYPKTASYASKFSDRSFQELIAQQKIFDGSESEINQYPEGINPLRAELSRTITRDLQLPVLRLSYFAEYLEKTDTAGEKQQACKEAYEAIDRIHQVYQKITALRSQVNNVEASEHNLQIFAELEKLQASDGPLATFAKFVNHFEKTHLPPDFAEKTSGRLVPFYKKLPFVPEEQIKNEIRELEKASFEAAGLASPQSEMRFN